ncbi:hypothetical protein C7999DRAFT_17406, partial [Corynascus novoguineensis]
MTQHPPSFGGHSLRVFPDPQQFEKMATPEQSCSRELNIARRGLRKQAWWACGPAMEQFDRDIFPLIEKLLRNADLGNEDLYLRLYMIGKSRSMSRPVIMVCCSNPRVRAQAEESIRASSIPDTYPEFALGACAIPLEQPGLVRGL